MGSGLGHAEAFPKRSTQCRVTYERELNFGGYSRRVNQSGACSNSDVITSGGRKSQTTMEDKFIVAVCGYPELYIHNHTFTKTGIHFAMRLELPGRSPSHDANSHLLCSEFHTRMGRISRVNGTSKLKMFKRPTSRDLFASFASGVNAPSVYWICAFCS